MLGIYICVDSLQHVCFSFFHKVYEIVCGCSAGRGRHCVTQSCLVVAGWVCEDFLGGVCEHCSLVLCEIKKNGGRLTARLFSVFHCLISILSPAVRKTNYVFNPCFTPLPLLFRSSHLEIIMSLCQTTLPFRKEEGENSEKSICLRSNKLPAITGNLSTLRSCRLEFFQAPTKKVVDPHTC